MNDTRYIQFPLSLIRTLFIDNVSTINKIICYGVYNFSHKIKYSVEDVARQIIYDFYRDKLSLELREAIKEVDNDQIIGTNQDYKCWGADGQFDASEEIEALQNIFSNNALVKFGCIEHYQVHQAKSILRVNSDTLYILSEAKKINAGNEPQPSVNIALLWDFRDNEKTEFESAQFLAYIATRSILGKKQYVKTNKQHIISRMFGYASIIALPATFPKPVEHLIKKYSARYHFDKVVAKLEMDWYVLTYSKHLRGMYIAMSNKISRDELIMCAESKKEKNRVERLKSAKAEARKKAIEQLNKNDGL